MSRLVLLGYHFHDWLLRWRRWWWYRRRWQLLMRLLLYLVGRTDQFASAAGTEVMAVHEGCSRGEAFGRLVVIEVGRIDQRLELLRLFGKTQMRRMTQSTDLFFLYIYIYIFI